MRTYPSSCAMATAYSSFTVLLITILIYPLDKVIYRLQHSPFQWLPHLVLRIKTLYNRCLYDIDTTQSDSALSKVTIRKKADYVRIPLSPVLLDFRTGTFPVGLYLLSWISLWSIGFENRLHILSATWICHYLSVSYRIETKTVHPYTVISSS